MKDEMKKRMTTKTVYEKQQSTPFLFKDYKSELLDDDILEVGYDEGYYNEDSSWESHYFVIIKRQVLETDRELDKRLEHNKSNQERMKERRREAYITLKKEFEDER